MRADHLVMLGCPQSKQYLERIFMEIQTNAFRFRALSPEECTKPLKILNEGERADVIVRKSYKGLGISNVPVRFAYSLGLNWGYAGTGPQALALCILYHFTKDLKFSGDWYHPFTTEIISSLPQNVVGVVISKDLIESWIQSKEGASSYHPRSCELVPTNQGFVYTNEGRIELASETIA